MLIQPGGLLSVQGREGLVGCRIHCGIYLVILFLHLHDKEHRIYLLELLLRKEVIRRGAGVTVHQFRPLQAPVLDGHLLHGILHAAVVHIAYDVQQIHLHGVQISGERRHPPTTVLVPSQREAPFVQIAVYVDSETEGQETFEDGDVVAHAAVEALRTGQRNLVFVDSKHEGIYLDLIVPYYCIHVQILYLPDILVLEHQQARHLAKRPRILYKQILARNAHKPVERRHQHIHIGVQLRRNGHIASQIALERFERRHHSIDRRQHVDDVICGHFEQMHVQACRDVRLALGGVESIEFDAADIALHIHVLNLEYAVTYIDFGCSRAYLQRGIVNPFGRQPYGTAEISGHNDGLHLSCRTVVHHIA